MFEAHITIPRNQYEKAYPYALMYGFHMSNITDDEMMGPGPKAYCTRSDPDFMKLHSLLMNLGLTLTDNGVRVMRHKIEAVLIDQVF